MSGLRDQNINRAANVAKHPLAVAIVTDISLTGAVVYSFVPGYKFQIAAAVRSFCRTKAGTVTAAVKVGTRTAATIVFTAATEVSNTLSTTLANLRGSSTEAITVELTTDGSGVLTNAFLTIAVRPFPLEGDIGPRS